MRSGSTERRMIHGECVIDREAFSNPAALEQFAGIV